mmetsp:Transcript_120022/g.224386  ORF Transcript_120022/g.224386 Transcript_120022/m.224386 type:complete len:142 (+) Transcript_120022:92-517(+)
MADSTCFAAAAFLTAAHGTDAKRSMGFPSSDCITANAGLYNWAAIGVILSAASQPSVIFTVTVAIGDVLPVATALVVLDVPILTMLLAKFVSSTTPNKQVKLPEATYDSLSRGADDSAKAPNPCEVDTEDAEQCPDPPSAA